MEDLENLPVTQETPAPQNVSADMPGENGGGDVPKPAALGGQDSAGVEPHTGPAVGVTAYPGYYPQYPAAPGCGEAAPPQLPYPYAPPRGGGPYGYGGEQPPAGYPPPQSYPYSYPGGYPYPPAAGGWGQPQPAPKPELDPARIKSAKRSAVMCLVFGCVSTLVSLVYFILSERMFWVSDYLASYPTFAVMVIMMALSVTGLVLSIMARKDLPHNERGVATAAMILCIIAIPFTMFALSVSGCIMCVDITCSGSRCY